LVPVYVVGSKADLPAVTGENSTYRDPERIKALYGHVPEHTLNPQAEYADQSDLYHVQDQAAKRGAKYLFTVWFDGMDWQPLRAAILARTGQDLAPGEASPRQWLGPLGLADAPIQFGSVVTSPTHADPPDEDQDLDRQEIHHLERLLTGGYDARFGGPDPWTPGPLLSQAPGYLRGQAATPEERKQVEAAGGVLHAYTDSAPSAGEYATGVKMTNNLINVTDDGKPAVTLFQQLQEKGWAVGTVTSVPFSHASPAAMYAHNVSREDYQDLSREMLGMPSIMQELGKEPLLPGLDVVIGCGWGAKIQVNDSMKQGKNTRVGPTYLTEADLEAIDADRGGRYVVAQRTSGLPGAEVLRDAAGRAARENRRLFGFFGVASGHLPFRTADGDYLPAKGISGVAERYSPADLRENPTLADMTRAALTVLSAETGRPFALFVEPGDVDFALHDNNLDNAIGAIASGEEAIRVIVEWVNQHSNWDESVLIVTADHGHYLVIDDPDALRGLASPTAEPLKPIDR
jgi:alkaline phosphatase